MDSDEIFNQLVEVYNDGDIDSFNRLNDEYMLNLDSIDEIADIEDREGLELDENNDSLTRKITKDEFCKWIEENKELKGD